MMALSDLDEYGGGGGREGEGVGGLYCVWDWDWDLAVPSFRTSFSLLS